MSHSLVILLGNDLELRFQVRSNPLAKLWLERMHQRHAWPMDNPDRFYGFGTAQQEQDRARDMIQQCIATINNHQHIIDREFEYTQDGLNYLHNIFERYHGLLDQQTSEYWHSAPDTVRQALANLNLAVHRCETVATEIRPKLVCTWYGMPKIKHLALGLQDQYSDWQVKFGTVYLNYCEIGKTTEDLAHDNDKYIGDDAFRPFDRYSADFNIQFHDQDLVPQCGKIQKYIDQHRDFFVARGITNVYNTQARPIRLPVADLVYNGNQEQTLAQIAKRQWVQQVTIQ